MKTGQVIRKLEDAGFFELAEQLLVLLPDGSYGYVKDVVTENGEVVLITTLDARDIAEYGE